MNEWELPLRVWEKTRDTIEAFEKNINDSRKLFLGSIGIIGTIVAYLIQSGMTMHAPGTTNLLWL